MLTCGTVTSWHWQSGQLRPPPLNFSLQENFLPVRKFFFSKSTKFGAENLIWGEFGNKIKLFRTHECPLSEICSRPASPALLS